MAIKSFKYNHATNEAVTEELEGDELAEFLDLQQKEIARKEAETQAKLDAENKRAEILERLGLTADEAKLLIG
jgi:hypothetical protein